MVVSFIAFDSIRVVAFLRIFLGYMSRAVRRCSGGVAYTVSYIW